MKGMQAKVASITALEPAMEKLTDEELQAKTPEFRARLEAGRDDRRPPHRGLRGRPRARPARPRDAPVRRPDDRRDDAQRRARRRDEDRRGQDLRRRAGGLPQRAHGARGPRGHGQRLPGQPRRRVDAAALRRARHQHRRDRVDDARGPAPRRLRRRRHLRHQRRVRLRLPARQHGRAAGRLRPARPLLLHRGRGRLDPDRRGPHAADHLRRPRGGDRHLLPLRADHADAGPRPTASGTSA